jgi:membrane-bound lytic murein transglycosylase A
MTNIKKHYILIAFLFLSGCFIFNQEEPEDPKLKEFKRVPYKHVENWGKDSEIQNVVPAFAKSCAVYEKRNPSIIITKYPRETKAEEWHRVCAPILRGDIDESNAQKYFEDNFDIYLIGDKKNGLVTGYYHIFLKGHREKNETYQYPIYGVPEDLVEMSLSDFNIQNDRSSRIVGRVSNKKFIPYYTYEEIENGALQDKAKIIAYTDNPLERFLMHVQGSGTLMLEDGTRLKLDYAGKNGQAFKGLGGQLIAAGYTDAKSVNLEVMLNAYKERPDEVKKMLANNKSYVFFSEATSKEVIGGMGIGLTPKRSLAVDVRYIAYGVPIWLELPDYNGNGFRGDINQMMVAQDTGGAIVGSNRLDFYWGEGDDAGLFAGNTKNRSSVYILIPKNRN